MFTLQCGNCTGNATIETFNCAYMWNDTAACADCGFCGNVSCTFSGPHNQMVCPTKPCSCSEEKPICYQLQSSREPFCRGKGDDPLNPGTHPSGTTDGGGNDNGKKNSDGATSKSSILLMVAMFTIFFRGTNERS